MTEINLPLILLAALVATISPGPATMAIAGASMQGGRLSGLALASGVTTGSFCWSIAAALGLSAAMLAHAWAFEVMRYFGVGYLFYLAVKSARSALTPNDAAIPHVAPKSLKAAYGKGLALHLTNPKAILFFGSLYAIGVPPDAGPAILILVICAVGLQSFVLFHAYALLFSSAAMTQAYQRARRWFEMLFAAAFGYASVRILLARIE